MLPTYLESRLAWVIGRTQLTQPRADRRLNGFENVLAQLASQWRAVTPLDPVRELRMASATRAALFDWIEREERAKGKTAKRLAAYASETVSDESVPDGWVRVLLDRRAQAASATATQQTRSQTSLKARDAASRDCIAADVLPSAGTASVLATILPTRSVPRGVTHRSQPPGDNGRDMRMAGCHVGDAIPRRE
jgi:hypothetical protein